MTRKKKGKHGEKESHEKKPDEKKSEEKKEEEEKIEKKHGEKHVEPPIVTVTFKDLEEELIQKVRQIYLQHSKVETFDDKPEEVTKIINEAKGAVPEEYSNKLPYILFNAIFDVNIAKEVSKNKAIISKAYEEISTHNHELDILLSLERFLLVKNISHDFEKYIPTIVKFFYDEDLLSEEFLLDWDKGKFGPQLIMDFRYQKSVDERFKAASKPILKWLKDEDGDGEEEKEKANGKGEGEGSDIDIDDI